MGLLDAANRVQSSRSPDEVEITDEYREVFVAEAREHLEDWESALLALENQPNDAELINQLFRAIHTIKGSAGFIGFEQLQRITHDLESTLQQVRDGDQPLTAARTDVLFKGLDLSSRMVETFANGAGWKEDIAPFLHEVSETEVTVEKVDGTPAPARPPSATTQQPPAPQEPAEPQGHSEPAEPRGPSEPEGPPPSDAATSHPVVVAAQSQLVETPTASGTRKFKLEIHVNSNGREGFLRAFLLRSRLATIATILSEKPAPETLKDSLGRFTYTIIVATEKEEADLRATTNIDQIELLSIAEEDEAPAAQTAAVPDDETEADHGVRETPGERSVRHDEVVRVSVDRLDTLLNLVGELVVQNSNFTSLTEEFEETYGRVGSVLRLQEKTEGLAKITRDLQDGIMKVRMLPVNTVFMRFHRVVRDLAHTSGKEVSLDIFGGETEIDKKVIDRIGDPLVHLIRNAVDHGIENREERASSGKPRGSSVRLGAYQDGDHICIEVSDDGKGLDKDAILRKAQEKGLIDRDVDDLAEQQVLDLIFEPGFSTAEKITDVSGRGVGMDAVKQTIEQLGGNVRIRSYPGRGTTVTITLPLTMAIIRAVLVDVSGQIVAIPLSAVKEVLKVTSAEMQSVGRRKVIRLREEVLAVVELREVLEFAGNGRPSDEDSRFPVIVVDYEDRKIGIAVDEVVGTHEIVIKSLSRHYREVDGFIGATILGDGRIALIVDVEAIIRQYHRANTESSHAAGSARSRVENDHRDTAVPPPGDGARAPAGRNGAPTSESRPVEPRTEPAKAEAAAVQAKVEDMGELVEVEERLDDANGGSERSEENLETAYERAVEVLTQVGSSGALRASMALSQITATEVQVGFPESVLVKLSEVAEIMGGEEAQIAGIYVGITGGMTGGILIAVPEDKVVSLHDYLGGSAEAELPGGNGQTAAEEPVPTNEERSSGGEPLDEQVDMSAIAEFGNLLSASFINAISDETEILIHSEPPEISVDMCLAVIDSVVARFNRPGDHTLLTKVVVYFEGVEAVSCSLLLFLDPESLSRLLTAFAAEAV